MGELEGIKVGTSVGFLVGLRVGLTVGLKKVVGAEVLGAELDGL